MRTMRLGDQRSRFSPFRLPLGSPRARCWALGCGALSTATRRPALAAALALGAAALWPGAVERSTPSAAADARAGIPSPLVPAHRQANVVAVLGIEGPIDHVTLRSLERRVATARNAGAEAIVLRLNTPGGELSATLEICHLIRTECPPNTVAWVDPSAYSAGAIIALACREIVMSPNGRMGDATPIAVSPVFGLQPLGPAERAKLESPLIAEVVDSARRRHHDENLVKSFVTLSPGLWLIEDTVTGERAVVGPEEFRAALGRDPVQAPARSIERGTSIRPPTPWVNKIFESDRKPRGSRRNAQPPTPEQLAEEVEAAQTLPPVREMITSSEPGRWRVLHQVLERDRLLTLTAEEAAYYGISAATIADEAELRKWFGATRLIELDESWSEHLVRFLVNPLVRGALLVIFIVCLFIELSVPGFGVFGTTALVALLLFVGAPLLAGLAQWWEVVLILAGLGLIAVEVFVLPGFGLAGVLGGACLLVGLVGTFVAAGAGGDDGRNDLLRGIATTVGSFIVSGFALWLISKKLQAMPLFRRFTLEAELPSPGVRSGEGSLGSLTTIMQALQPGELGVAATDLRPGGRGQFSGRLVDVASNGEWIERGSPIRIVSIGRFEIEVEVVR